MKPAIRRQRHVRDGGAGAIAGHCYARRRIRMEPPPGPESCTAFRNVRSTSRSIDSRRQQFCPGMDDAGHGFPGKILRYDGVSIADICTGRDPRFRRLSIRDIRGSSSGIRPGCSRQGDRPRERILIGGWERMVARACF